jgi:hypothetical protein
MPKARNYHLTEQELKAVKTAIHRDKHPEVRQRYTVIYNKTIMIDNWQIIKRYLKESSIAGFY